jgi:hypothetical protein
MTDETRASGPGREGEVSLGLSGRLTRAFIGSPLTPLFLLAAFALGLIALFGLPREEEPMASEPRTASAS